MSRNGAVAESILAEGRSSGLRSDRHGHARAARDPGLTPGSDAEMVVRHSPLPVLLVNQSPASRRSCSRSFSAAGLGAGVG